MQEETKTIELEESDFSRQSELTAPESKLISTYSSLLKVLEIMETCTEAQSNSTNPN